MGWGCPKTSSNEVEGFPFWRWRVSAATLLSCTTLNISPTLLAPLELLVMMRYILYKMQIQRLLLLFFQIYFIEYISNLIELFYSYDALYNIQCITCRYNLRKSPEMQSLFFKYFLNSYKTNSLYHYFSNIFQIVVKLIVFKYILNSYKTNSFQIYSKKLIKLIIFKYIFNSYETNNCQIYYK